MTLTEEESIGWLTSPLDFRIGEALLLIVVGEREDQGLGRSGTELVAAFDEAQQDPRRLDRARRMVASRDREAEVCLSGCRDDSPDVSGPGGKA